MDLGNFGFDFRFGNILKDLERFERLSKTHLRKVSDTFVNEQAKFNRAARTGHQQFVSV